MDLVGLHAQRRMGRQERVPDRSTRGTGIQQQASNCPSTRPRTTSAGGLARRRPRSTVFNHDAWAGRIKHLVDEILEIERRLGSRVLTTPPYHFDLHNLDYTRETDTAHFTKKGEYRLLSKVTWTSVPG